MTAAGKMYLGLGIAQALHSMEEMYMHLYDFFWTATGFFQHFDHLIPQFRMKAEVFAILNMGIIVIILASVPFVESKRRWAIQLAWCWAVIEILNGLFHMGAAVVLSRYVPGVLSAPLLLAVGILLWMELLRQRRIVESRAPLS